MPRSYSTFDQQWICYQQDNSALSSSNSTGFSVENGLWIEKMDGWSYQMLSRNGSRKGTSGYYINGATMMASYGTGNPAATNTFQESDTLIWAMSMMQVLPDPTDNDTVWPNLPIKATECGLFYCVNSYTANVTNGILYEDEQPASNSLRASDSWQPYGGSTFLTPSQVDSIQFDDCVSSVPRTDLTLGSGYNITWTSVNSISAFINSTFALED